jgi:DNA-binding response OmpR family regulator
MILHRLGICFIPASLNTKSRRKYGLFATNNSLYVFGREIFLSVHETDLVVLLLKAPPGQYVSRDAVLDAWGDTGELTDRSVDWAVKKLRIKVFPTNEKARHLFIQTSYKRGYRIPERWLLK